MGTQMHLLLFLIFPFAQALFFFIGITFITTGYPAHKCSTLSFPPFGLIPLNHHQAQFPGDTFPSCLQGNVTWDISGVIDIVVNVLFRTGTHSSVFLFPAFLGSESRGVSRGVLQGAHLQRCKKRQMRQIYLCYFFQLVLISGPFWVIFLPFWQFCSFFGHFG